MSTNIGEISAKITADASGFKQGLGEAKSSMETFAEGAIVLEAVKAAIEAISKAAEFMGKGLEDAAAMGNGPAFELTETLGKAALAGRQLGADLASNLAPALNSLISYFTDGADMGKILANVAEVLGIAFRALVSPLVAAGGAIKGLIDGGNLESAMNGAATATALLAKHGSDFAGSLKTAAEQASIIAAMQQQAAVGKIQAQSLRTQDQYADLTGNRHADKGAAAKAQFADFDAAILYWQQLMMQAAGETEIAANLAARGATVLAEKHKILADVYTTQAGVAMEGAEAWTRAREVMIANMHALAMAGAADSRANTLTDVGRSSSDARRERDYGNIGRSANSVNKEKTAGFDSFDAALKASASALSQQEQLISAAKMMDLEATQLAAAGQMDNATAALDSAQRLRLLAQQSGLASQAAEDAATAFIALKSAPSQFVQGLQIGLDAFTAATGKLGATINAGIKGGEQGGIWGALIAVIMQFVTQAKGFSQIMNIGNGQFQMALNDMSQGLNDLFKDLAPLMGAIEQIASAVHGILSPILSLIGSLLKGLAPLLALIGLALQPLGSIIGIIGGILSNSLTPALQIMGPLMFAIDEILMAVQLAFQYLKLGLDVFLDWIKKAVSAGTDHSGQDAVDADNLAIYGPNGTIQKMKDMASAEWAGISSGTTLSGGVDQLNQSSADAAAALGKTANAAQAVSEQLMNVPSAYKVALSAFNAMQGTGSSSITNFTGPGGVTIPTRRLQFLHNGNPVSGLVKYPKKK